MSKDEPQSEGMKALEQSLNDHMEICRLQRKAKRLKVENARLKAEVERLTNCKSEADRLKAEVERLKQEKNELAVMIHPVVLKAWMNLNAVKEGNQP